MNESFRELILVIEDDVNLARGIAHNLRFEGYRVSVASDGHSGLRMACDERPDLILLDLMLPGIGGLEVLRSIREVGLTMQVIILSARGQETDKVTGLLQGADDYVTKPFGIQELLARVEASLRRPRQARQDEAPLTFGAYSIDGSSRTLRRDGEDVRLTGKEFDLLLFLVRHPGRSFSREVLLREVWGFGYEGTERTVDNFVHQLRIRIETDPAKPQYIKTVHGIGYRFTPPEQGAPRVADATRSDDTGGSSGAAAAHPPSVEHGASPTPPDP